MLPIETEVKWPSSKSVTITMVFKSLQYAAGDVQKWLSGESGIVAMWYSNKI